MAKIQSIQETTTTTTATTTTTMAKIQSIQKTTTTTNKTKQNKTKQNKAKQNITKQNNMGTSDHFLVKTASAVSPLSLNHPLRDMYKKADWNNLTLKWSRYSVLPLVVKGVPMDPNSESPFPNEFGGEMQVTDKIIQKNQNTAKKSKIG